MLKATKDDQFFNISQVYLKLKNINAIAIRAIYYGSEKIWSLIRSCFGSGFWVNSSNWSNTELWKN